MLHMTVLIFTDGSCDHYDDRRPGGWAFIILHKNKEYSNANGCLRTTNNQQELNAILEALWELNVLELNEDEWVILCTDSEWSLKCLTREYDCTKKQKKTGKVGGHVAWLDAIWAKMSDYKKFEYMKVPAHACNVMNKRVDAMSLEKMEWARANLR